MRPRRKGCINSSRRGHTTHYCCCTAVVPSEQLSPRDKTSGLVAGVSPSHDVHITRYNDEGLLCAGAGIIMPRFRDYWCGVLRRACLCSGTARSNRSGICMLGSSGGSATSQQLDELCGVNNEVCTFFWPLTNLSGLSLTLRAVPEGKASWPLVHSHGKGFVNSCSVEAYYSNISEITGCTKPEKPASPRIPFFALHCRLCTVCATFSGV